jgi:hypothetical protein
MPKSNHSSPQQSLLRKGGGGPSQVGPVPSSERLAEIAEILAAGLMRLRARKSSGLLPREADFSLGTFAHQSGAVAEIEGDIP